MTETKQSSSFIKILCFVMYEIKTYYKLEFLRSPTCISDNVDLKVSICVHFHYYGMFD